MSTVAVASSAACDASSAITPVVVHVRAVDVPPDTDTWRVDATRLRGQNGGVFELDCPPNGSKASVWGTDLYTDDSSICTAAVHAGKITLDGGGVVRIVIRPGAAAYLGSNQHGVRTERWAAWEGSYTFFAP